MRDLKWLAALALLVLLKDAQASLVSFSYNSEFSDGRSPGGPAPWLTATFDDHGSTGRVTLTISTSGLVASENVSALYFNMDPANTDRLSFTYETVLSTGPSAKISTNENAFTAGNSGRYDILFKFPSNKRFNKLETVVYDIVGTNLTAQSFNFPSSLRHGNESLLSAAHVQDFAQASREGSGWVVATADVPAVVPVPGAAWLFVSGLLCMLGLSLRHVAV